MPLNHIRRGSGEPLVLIHGVGSQHQVWEPVLDRLAAEREVVALDLPGFGGSASLAPGERPDAPRLARAVIEFLDELGWDRPHVGGNSLGGWIALELAKAGRARSVAAIGPAGFFTRKEARWSEWSLIATGRLTRTMYDAAPRLLASATGRKLVLSQVFARPERMTVDQAVGVIRNVPDSPGFDETLRLISRDHLRGLDAVRVPVTLMWGQRERLLIPRRRQAERSLRVLPGARLLWLRGCGHTPFWDDPPQVAQAILDATRV